jgi:hypothetical protein
MQSNARRKHQGHSPASRSAQTTEADIVALQDQIRLHAERIIQARQERLRLEEIIREFRRRRDEEQAVIAASRSRSTELAGLRKRIGALLEQVRHIGGNTERGDYALAVAAEKSLKAEGAVERARQLDMQRRRNALVELRSRVGGLIRRVAQIGVPPAPGMGTLRQGTQEKPVTSRQKKLAALRSAVHSLLQRVQSLSMPDRNPERASLQMALDSLLVERQQAVDAVRGIHRRAKELADQRLIIQDIVSGASSEGLGRYLSRASPATRKVVDELMAEARARGQAGAGRTARQLADPVAEARRERKIERERERRQRARVALAALPEEARAQVIENRLAKRRDNRRRQRKAEQRAQAPDPILDGSRPRTRKHEKRIAAAAPDERGMMTARVLTARERGWAAAVRDEASRRSFQTGTWCNPHDPMPLPDGCRLIAVRGGSENAAETMRAILQPGGLEQWLMEPVMQRSLKIGGRSRLVFGAGHLVAAWSDILKDMARSGDSLEEAAAYRVDEAIARMDLAGHRVAAFWHTDSKSGHPHLHIVWARVRDEDLSVWSLESRARASVLWLHARSNTVAAAGAETLPADVDALAGYSDAAVDAEVLLAHDLLTVQRRLLDGTVLMVPVQGEAAARRLAQVGSGPRQLAGGIWRFGLGPEPKPYRAWKRRMEKAELSGDEELKKAVRAERPPIRGYWLPLRGHRCGLAEVLNDHGLGTYLARCA